MKNRIFIICFCCFVLAALLGACKKNESLQFDKKKWGLISPSGDWVLQPKYDMIFPFREGRAAVQRNNKWGFIDKKGTEVVPIVYERVHYVFSENFAGIRVNNKWGFIDKNGKIAIEPEFEFVGSFSEGLAKVKINNKWGFIDKTGKIAIKPEFDDVVPEGLDIYKDISFFDGCAIVEVGVKKGVIDKTGKYIIPLQDKRLRFCSEDLIAAEDSENYLWGYIDKTGKWIVPPKYKYAGLFSDGLALVAEEEKLFGYIQKNGEYFIKPQFTLAFHFYKNFAVAYKKNLRNIYLYDKKKKSYFLGNGIAETLYLSDGYIPIKKLRKIGFKSKGENYVIPPKFNSCFNFSEGLAPVTLEGDESLKKKIIYAPDSPLKYKDF